MLDHDTRVLCPPDSNRAAVAAIFVLKGTKQNCRSFTKISTQKCSLFPYKPSYHTYFKKPRFLGVLKSLKIPKCVNFRLFNFSSQNVYFFKSNLFEFIRVDIIL